MFAKRFQHPVYRLKEHVYQQINTHVDYYLNIVINMGVNICIYPI